MTSDFSAGTSSRLPPLPTQLDVPKIPPTQNIGKEYIRFSPFQIHLCPTNHLQREREQLNDSIETPEKREVWKTFNLEALFLPELNGSIETQEKKNYGKLSTWNLFFLPERPDWLVCRSDLRCPSDHTRLVSVFHVPALRKDPAR